jgi:pilus assembly protein FimV
MTSEQPPASQSAEPGAQPPAASAQAGAEAQGAAQADTAAAKQALSDARDTLSQITAMPEAARLQGEARTEVAQLIANFNELITTQTDWRAAYAKVDASLNALLGSSASEAPDTGMTGSAAGTAGTTGTSGAASATGTTGSASAAASVQLDPAIRAKLVEFRTKLQAFAQAAGGGVEGQEAQPSSAPAQSAIPPSSATSSSTNPANPATPASPANPAAPPNPSTTPSSPANPPESANPPASTAPANPSEPSAPTASGQSVGTSGAVAPSATGTTGTGNMAQADRELDAIQAILGQAKNGKLDKSQVDQLKAHVDQLRQLLGQSGGH